MLHPRSVAPAAPLAAWLVACATVPAALQPGPGHRELALVTAHGVQIYECRADDGAAGPRWTFVAPEAALLDRQGQHVGTHGAGPHWMALDGSRVEGTVVAREPAARAEDIAWLLLRTRSTGASGHWANVTAIQRVNTEGGMAPSTACDASRLGQSVRVPYRATYRLFVAA